MKQLLFGSALLFIGACSNESNKSTSREASNSTANKKTEESSTYTQKAGQAQEITSTKKPEGTDKTGTITATTQNTGEQNGQSVQEEKHGQDNTVTLPSDDAPPEELRKAANTTDPVIKPASFAPTENEDEIIFVGSFAQWKQSNGSEFDGSYDATHGLFVVCKTDKSHKVPSSQIVYLEFGNCDEPLADRIKMFRIKKNGDIEPNGNRIKIVGDKGLVMVNGTQRIIKLDVPTRKKIESEKASMMKPKLRVSNEKVVVVPSSTKSDETDEGKKMVTSVRPDDKPVAEKQTMKMNNVDSKVETTKVLAQPSKITSIQNEQLKPSSPPAKIAPTVKTSPVLIDRVTPSKNMAIDTAKTLQKQRLSLPKKQVMKQN
jgi:hypothetical protein